MLEEAWNAATAATDEWGWLWASMPLFAAHWCVRLALRLLRHAVLVKRVYRSKANRKMTLDAIDALAKLPRALRIGAESFADRMVPVLLISASAVATGQVRVEMDGESAVALTVWSPRWAAPVVSDPKPQAASPGTITVLQRVSNRDDRDEMEEFQELAVPARGLPPQALASAHLVADAMADTLNSYDRAATVFVLHGSPGCGKSTAVRLLAKKLDATLYADYNPTTPTDNLRCLMGTYATHKSALVVAYEECDVSFAKIATGTARRPNDFRPDAIDKASWNALLDAVKRRVNVVVVMTTNRTRAELAALADTDTRGSMLRRGRVDAHFEWVPGAPPRMTPADEATPPAALALALACPHEPDDDADDAKDGRLGPSTPDSDADSAVHEARCDRGGRPPPYVARRRRGGAFARSREYDD